MVFNLNPGGWFSEALAHPYVEDRPHFNVAEERPESWLSRQRAAAARRGETVGHTATGSDWSTLYT